MPPVPGFANGSYVSRSGMMAGERCMNLFPELVPMGGKTRSALVPAPGLTSFASLSTGPGRGIFAQDGRVFTVYGTTLWELYQNGTSTNRGTVAIDANPVTFDTNGDGGGQLLITSGDLGYIFTLSTNVLTQPVANVTFGGQIDGFFTALDADTSTLRISASLDGATWTQSAQRTAFSDPWLAMITVEREAVLIGETTGEVWHNAGRSPFPFALRSGGEVQVGILAPFSLARFGGSCAWLGRTEHGSYRVFWMNGYTPVPISTPGIDWIIQTYVDGGSANNALGWSYEREGHQCYVLHFPDERAWVYDLSTNQWHERGYWDTSVARFTGYRPLFHATAWGRNLVCDSDGTDVYSLSSTTYTDAGGAALLRQRRTPHQSQENARLCFPYFELECQKGVGLTSGQGSAPLVGLRYSNDGGNTWGERRDRSVGARGNYTQRVRWDLCGSGRDRVWELSSSDPVATVWFDAYTDVETCLN